MKRKLLCPPESLKIISRTKHVCQDFVLQTKKTLEDTEDIFRPRFPVVQYFINFQRGFETSHYTPFSRMNFISVRLSERKTEQHFMQHQLSDETNFLLVTTILRVRETSISKLAPSLQINNKIT